MLIFTQTIPRNHTDKATNCPTNRLAEYEKWNGTENWWCVGEEVLERGMILKPLELKM